MEAKYVVIIKSVKECIQLNGILEKLKLLQESPIIFTNSQSALLLCINLVYHERSKHIEVKYQFIREKIACGEVILEKIYTNVNPSDIGTKILTLVSLNLVYLSCILIKINLLQVPRVMLQGKIPSSACSNQREIGIWENKVKILKCLFRDPKRAFKSEKSVLNIVCPCGTKSLAYLPQHGSVFVASSSRPLINIHGCGLKQFCVSLQVDPIGRKTIHFHSLGFWLFLL